MVFMPKLSLQIMLLPIQIQSSLSPSGNPVITDTLISIWTAAIPHAKINYTRLTEINSHYYRLSQMRTLTQGSYSIRYKRS